MELKDKEAIDKMFEELDKTYNALGADRFVSIANDVFTNNFGGPEVDEYFNEFQSSYLNPEAKLENYASFTQHAEQKSIKKPSVSFANGWVAAQITEVMEWSNVQNLLHDHGVKYIFPDYATNGVMSNLYSFYNPPGWIQSSNDSKIKNHQTSADGFLF